MNTDATHAGSPPQTAPEDIAPLVGERLRAIRAERGLSLGALATMAGIGKGSLSEIEHGTRNPTLSTLYALANALELPLAWLLAERTGAEVSSPGIERPLFKEVDYQRFVGEEIQLLTTERIDDRKKFKGFIRSFSQGVLILELEDKMCHIPFEKIRKANLAYQP